MAGFLANDIVDADDFPDILYLSDGTTENVSVTANIQCISGGENQYTLTVTPTSEGWNYGVFSDPTNGRQELISVTDRSNGANIDLRNFWQTDRTLRDGKDPLNENRLHFADKFLMAADKSYTLTFAPKPDVTLEVESFSDVPTELATIPVTSIKVRFNKPIDASTFTTDDLTINWQGEEQDASLVEIATTDNQEFTLELLTLTAKHSGYFTLAVQTAGITDNEGFTGKTGKIIGWNQLVGGKVCLTVKVDPAEYGKATLTPAAADNLYDFQSVVTLKAEPNDGYEFVRWSRNGETLSAEAEYRYTVLSEKPIKAEFKARLYDVTVKEVAKGGSIVANSGTGKYEYNTELVMTAAPEPGYTFEGWYVNEALYESNEVLRIQVNADIEIAAVFKAIPVIPEETVTYDLLSGWNWISVNVADKNLNNLVSLFAPLADNLLTVRGQEGDPTVISPDKSYKVKVQLPAQLELKGIPYSSIDVTITLAQGWNWIGYIPSFEQTVDEALSTLAASENEVIKNQTGFAMYDGNAWVGSLNTLLPGCGYMYYAEGVKSFNYNAGSSDAPHTDVPVSAGGWSYDARKYADNTNIVARLYDGTTEVKAGEYLLAAFVGNECRGIAVEKNGYQFLTIHGETPDEKIEFRALNIADDETYDIKEYISFNGAIAGNFKQPLQLHFSSETGIDEHHAGFSIYPNPVKERLYIHGDLRDIREVRVTDMKGSVILGSVSEDWEKGIDVSGLADGVYFIHVQTGTDVFQCKFMKVE